MKPVEILHAERDVTRSPELADQLDGLGHQGRSAVVRRCLKVLKEEAKHHALRDLAVLEAGERTE